MSVIVVEGMDGSGKSTLLENSRLEIKKRYFLLLRQSCRPLTKGDAENFIDALDFSPSKPDLILDRHPLISEPIYGPLLRGENLVDNYTPGQIETMLRSVDRIIYCRPPHSVILDNLDKNPQMDRVKERFHDLLDAYDLRMHQLRDAGIPVKFYSWPHYSGTLEELFFGEPPGSDSR